MFKYAEITTEDDLKCLLNRVEAASDILKYNITYALGQKYFLWLERHKEMIDELEFMIKEDLNKE